MNQRFYWKILTSDISVVIAGWYTFVLLRRLGVENVSLDIIGTIGAQRKHMKEVSDE